MKSRDTLVRLKRFQVEDKRRRVAQIEMMIAEFNRMAGSSTARSPPRSSESGVKDTTHYAYSTYARAARTRRDNLLHSADELKGQLEEARGAVRRRPARTRQGRRSGRPRQGGECSANRAARRDRMLRRCAPPGA